MGLQLDHIVITVSDYDRHLLVHCTTQALLSSHTHLLFPRSYPVLDRKQENSHVLRRTRI